MIAASISAVFIALTALYWTQGGHLQSSNSTTFPGNRPTYTHGWILWHYWQSILCMSTLLNHSTGSRILLHQREAGVILTPRILWCILLVLSRVLNANQLISLRRNASSIILLHRRGGIVIRHVCLFVRLCVRNQVLGRNILKTSGDSCSVTMEHL